MRKVRGADRQADGRTDKQTNIVAALEQQGCVAISIKWLSLYQWLRNSYRVTHKSWDILQLGSCIESHWLCHVQSGVTVTTRLRLTIFLASTVTESYNHFATVSSFPSVQKLSLPCGSRIKKVVVRSRTVGSILILPGRKYWHCLQCAVLQKLRYTSPQAFRWCWNCPCSRRAKKVGYCKVRGFAAFSYWHFTYEILTKTCWNERGWIYCHFPLI